MSRQLLPTRARTNTLAERFDPRHNSLNALRLILAVSVIVSHTWPLGGFGPDPSAARQAVGHWAVLGFFGISGYLIAASRSRSSLRGFLAARVLRIYPAYFVCLILVAFAAAPLSAVIRPAHWTAHNALLFVAYDLLLKVERNSITGTLTHAPGGPAWDGSLWTLFYEFLCYIAIGVLLTVPRRWHGSLTAAAFTLTAIGNGLVAHRANSGTVTDLLSLTPVFFAGALLFLFAHRVPTSRLHGAGALAVLPLAGQLDLASSLAAPLVAYACLWLGAVLPLQRMGRRNDISYGMYIYAFPVQQLLAAAGLSRHGPALFASASVILTVPFGAASWLLIERPALALNRRLRRVFARRNQHMNSRDPRDAFQDAPP
jgi:peptidoglycan/LPS O-acetylase OafA/YrhL